MSRIFIQDGYSTSGNLTSLQNAGNAAFTPIKAQIDRPIEAGYKAVTSVPSKMRKWAGENAEKSPMLAAAVHIASDPLAAISDVTAKKWEDYQFNRLRDKALTSSANKAVLDEVKRNYGLEQKDIKLDAIKNYKEKLTEALKSVNPQMNEADIQKHVKSLSKQDYSKLKDELSKIKDAQGVNCNELLTHHCNQLLTHLPN